MKLVALGRGQGKTTRVLDWMKQAPEGEHRVCVTLSEEEAMRVYRSTFDEEGNPTWAESWQFVGLQGALDPKSWDGVLYGRGGRIVLAIDNLDLVLSSHSRREIGLVTLIAEEHEGENG